MTDSDRSNIQPALRREVGLFGAVMLGLGSMIGTGVFVSLGLAAELAGPAVVLAVVVAGGLALCNALNSAQLAANHPQSGGTYEYGYRWVSPTAGFSAGWMFLIAKTASAATAALAFAAYLLPIIGADTERWSVPAAAIVVAALTVLVLCGLRRSNRVNTVMVTITLLALLAFVGGSLIFLGNSQAKSFTPFFATSDRGSFIPDFLEACALVFVAYTGYGRIATLGEEVHNPRQTIPKAIAVTVAVTVFLYAVVATASIASVGANRFGEATDQDPAILRTIASEFDIPAVPKLLTVGAMTAMLGVLLNLILGLSRVVLAMGRRGDLPAVFSRINQQGTTPVPAVLFTGIGIAACVLVGDVKSTWSFSAFAVLIYYAITNLSAYRLSREERLYPRAIAVVGMFVCAGLAFWVEPLAWGFGLAAWVIGLGWHFTRRRWNRRANSPGEDGPTRESTDDDDRRG